MPYHGRKFTDVQCHPERLEQPLHWKKPRKIFVNSMSDLFHESVPYSFIDMIFAVMALCPQHIFQCLTKRSERMHDYLSALMSGKRLVCEHARWLFNGPHEDRVLSCMKSFGSIHEDLPTKTLANVWLGVSIEDQPTADERIPLLLDIPAVVHWLSIEPMLGPVDFNNGRRLEWLSPFQELDPMMRKTPRIDWVVVGGESGPNARECKISWVQSIKNKCNNFDIPIFIKQLGSYDYKGNGANPEEWPEQLRIRQYPVITS